MKGVVGGLRDCMYAAGEGRIDELLFFAKRATSLGAGGDDRYRCCWLVSAAREEMKRYDTVPIHPSSLQKESTSLVYRFASTRNEKEHC